MCLPLAGATLATAGVESQITARSHPHTNVMAGLVPAIHVFNLKAEMQEDVLGWTAPDGIRCAKLVFASKLKGSRPCKRLAELASIRRSICSRCMA
jgi:hypothetical protein